MKRQHDTTTQQTTFKKRPPPRNAKNRKNNFAKLFRGGVQKFFIKKIVIYITYARHLCHSEGGGIKKNTLRRGCKTKKRETGLLFLPSTTSLCFPFLSFIRIGYSSTSSSICLACCYSKISLRVSPSL